MAKTLEFITKRMDQKKAAIAKKEAALDKKFASYEKYWGILADNGVAVKNEAVAKFEKFLSDLRTCDNDEQLKALLEYGKAELILVRWDCREGNDHSTYGFADDYAYMNSCGGWQAMNKKQQAVYRALDNLDTLMASHNGSCSLLGVAQDIAELRRDLRVISSEHEEVKARDLAIPEILKDLEKSIADTLFKCDCDYRKHCSEKLPEVEKKLEDLRANPLFKEADRYWYTRSNNPEVVKLGNIVSGVRKTIEKYEYWVSRSDEDIRNEDNRVAHDLVLNLHQRIQGFCGEVTSWNNVEVTRGAQGCMVLNGVVDGTEGKCEVRSIEAGGWNIQPWHIRVLTLPIR